MIMIGRVAGDVVGVCLLLGIMVAAFCMARQQARLMKLSPSLNHVKLLVLQGLVASLLHLFFS